MIYLNIFFSNNKHQIYVCFYTTIILKYFIQKSKQYHKYDMRMPKKQIDIKGKF